MSGQSVRTPRTDCPETGAADTLSLFRECPSACPVRLEATKKARISRRHWARDHKLKQIRQVRAALRVMFPTDDPEAA